MLVKSSAKDVYHINALDEATQFEMVCAVEKISKQYLIPAIEQLLNCFPFVIQSFHSDNSPEYISYKVATLLGRLLIDKPNPAPDNLMAML
ncbi:MAG: hypothetical protein Q8N96_03540 [Methylovulum sp.]|nr:hypothetical protein [Methylovulum sp.]